MGVRNFINNKNEITCNTNETETKKLPKEVFIVAQEIKIVKALSCNNELRRNKQIRKLRRWLQLRAQSTIPFNEESFMRIWKGLYYNMWYSDKPLVQEELSEELGKLLNCFGNNVDLSIKFFGAFLKTMINEWFGIDQWRIDKFLMLVRRMLRYMLKILKEQKENEWSLESIQKFNEMATCVVIQEKIAAKGLTMHYMEIFFEELAKIAAGNITDGQVHEFLKPFLRFMIIQKDGQMVHHCRIKVFHHLLYQSRLGREYTEKYDAWKTMGFPTKHIDDLEKIENTESDNEIEDVVENDNDNEELDPRAGNVDVYMPLLPLNGNLLIKELESYLYKHEMSAKRRKSLKNLLESFRKYDEGTFPLGVKTMPRFEVKSKKPLIKGKIEQLDNLENELYGVDRKLKQLSKRKRRRLLKSLNFENINENNYEETIEKALPPSKSYLLKRKSGAVKAMMYGWLEEELDEHELPPSLNKIKHNKNNKFSNDIKQQHIQQKKKQKRIKRKNNVNGKINGNVENFKTTTENLSELKTLQDKDIVISKDEVFSENCKQEQQQQHEEDISKTSSSNDNGNALEEENTITITKASKIFINPNEEYKNCTQNEWELPLKEGEVEYFIPSRKLKLKEANNSNTINVTDSPLHGKHSTPLRGKRSSMSAIINQTTAKTTTSPIKRVRIVLQHNKTQRPREYIQQIKSSPNVPFDASKQPLKGVLKPNLMPSPINPFYRNKINLKLLNDTF